MPPPTRRGSNAGGFEIDDESSLERAARGPTAKGEGGNDALLSGARARNPRAPTPRQAYVPVYGRCGEPVMIMM